MKVASSSSASFYFSLFGLLFTLLSIIIATGCGSSGTTQTRPKLSGNTSVTVVFSSTANDQLQRFDIAIQSIALISESGKTVTLFSTPQGSEFSAEFIRVNGGIEPFVTVDVPQDIYTAAAVGVNQSSFTCVGLTPSGGLLTATYAYGSTPNNVPETNVTVNIASPITVTGDSMGLVLDLQVTKSASYSSCYSEGIAQYSITPSFNLTPITFAALPTNSHNGKVSQFDGQVTEISSAGNGFTLTLPNYSRRTVSISTNSGTAYQGINGFSALAKGTLVDLDGAIQADGSVLAKRIAVLDLSATDVQVGPAMIVGGDPLNGELSAWFFNRSSQGQDALSLNWPYNIHNAVFQISGQIGNLATLPFVASFNGTNLVAGQNVYVSTFTFHSPSDPYTPANTLTLMPQTINGTVVASQQSGSFTDYTVSLASYDLFPTLAVQQGQTTLLSNPSEVEVYVDNSTQKLNMQPLALGSTLSFYGLVFNDNGRLRMDCAQVSDGVTGSSQTSSVSQVSGQARMVRHVGPGMLQQTITTSSRPQ